MPKVPPKVPRHCSMLGLSSKLAWAFCHRSRCFPPSNVSCFFMCVCPEIGYIMVYRCFYRAYHNILKIAFYSGKRSFESLDLGTIRHRSCPWTKRHNIVRFFSTEPTAKCWENRKTQYASYDWDMGKHTGNHKSTTELFS